MEPNFNFFNSSAVQIIFGSFLSLITSVVVTQFNARLNKKEQQRANIYNAYLTFVEHHERGQELYNFRMKEGFRVHKYSLFQEDLAHLKKIHYTLISMFYLQFPKNTHEDFEIYTKLSKEMISLFSETDFREPMVRGSNTTALRINNKNINLLFEKMSSFFIKKLK